ncbi:MAG: hypothetical protein JWR38_4347 [Mucilaginibacter sp.]|nr:hypothetical protein [Mucilaginibacter sp.]
MNNTILQLANTVDDFQLIRSQPIDWETRPAPGKWSKKELIGHLIDSAHINLQRFIRCTYEENFKLTYEQDAWIAAQHYQEADINELFDLWTLLNKQIIRVLKNYPAERLGVSCFKNDNVLEPQLHTVVWLADDYLRHLHHHQQQIK